MNTRLLNLRCAITALHIVVLLAVGSAAREAGDDERKEAKAQTGDNVIAAVAARPATTENTKALEKDGSETSGRTMRGSPVAEPVQSGSDGWAFQLSPYIFMPAIKGTAGVGAFTADVDARFVDIIDEANFAFMAAFEARKNKFMILTDMMYINLSDSAGTPGPLFSSVKVDFKAFILDPEVGYRVVEKERASLDLLGGIRYWHLKTTLDFRAGILPERQEERSKNWVDVIGGVRGRARLSTRWFLTGKADLGGGGSDFSWQLFGGAGVDVNRRVSLIFGYRHLDVNYDDEDTGFVFDVAMKGPIIGFGFRF
ncbi:MAG TPA: hypothetical protein VG778_10025 [Blastocatellia bacterium]|jgi:hypothetical protein|nr:hypothetical protein [Blastocatellia bacterium]